MSPDAATVSASFGPADWIVVLLYMAIVTGIGLWTARGQKSQRDYFLGGRSLPWWAVGFSIVATETSALTFIGIPAGVIGALALTESGAITAGGGTMFFMMVVIGYITGRLVVIKYIIPHYFKGDVYTTYELIFKAFGNRSRITASALAVVAITLGAGVRVYVTAIPIMIVMRTIPGLENSGILEAVTIIMVAAMLYVALGGIKAVVWTDMLQYFIFVGAGLLALLYIPSLLHGDMAAPGGETGWNAVRSVAPEQLRWFNHGFVGAAAVAEGLGREPGLWELIKANVASIVGGQYNLISGILGAPIGIIFAFGFDQMNVQRVLACRNTRDGQKAMGLSAVIIGPQFLLFLLIGAALFAYYTINGWEFGAIKPWDPNLATPSPRSDFVFPIFILTHMPVVAKGFLIAAILAAAMSSVSSALGAIGSMAVMDFYRPFRRKKTDAKTEMLLSRGAVVLAGVGLIAVAMACRAAPLIFDLAFQLAGLTTGAIMGAFIWGLLHRRGRSGPVIAGMACSFFFMILFNFILNHTDYAVNWVWHALVGTVVCVAVIALASIPGEGIGLDETIDHDA